YFDNVQHTTLMKKVAERVNDDDVMRLLKLILKVGGAKGVPQGEVTRKGRFTYIEYARFADDVVVLVDGFGKWEWLLKAAYKGLVEEFEKLGVQMNLEKTQIVNLTQDETFSFLGFDFRRIKTRRGAWGYELLYA
ncbi:MAG: RNA-directed DNA polymerase, partial [Desulforhopalus sp.]